jgi:hypothetical protein
LDNIKRCSSPRDLAKLIIDSVAALFYRVSMADVVYYSASVKAITIQWLKLSNNIMACFIIDLGLALYIIKLASVYWRL